MSRVLSVFAILFLSLFVFVEVAQAGLIRNGGRTGLSRVYEQTVYYVNNDFNNAGGITEDIFEFNSQSLFSALSNRSARGIINGDNNPISAFPGDEGCTRGYEQAEFNQLKDTISSLDGIDTDPSADPVDLQRYNDAVARLAVINVNEPCKWQFTQGEMISVEGLFQMVFTGFKADEVDYLVDWEIDGVKYGGEIDLVDGQSFAAITLDKLIDLDPGEYNISVEVGISSEKGRFYYETPQSTDGSVTKVSLDPGVCAANPNFISEEQFRDNYLAANPSATPDDVNDAVIDTYNADLNISEPTQCGRNSIIQDTDAGTFDQNSFDISQVTSFISFTDTLIILDNGANDPAVEVSAPVSLGSFLAGLVAIGIRRRIAIRKSNVSV
jgi:hypothetical protein